MKGVSMYIMQFISSDKKHKYIHSCTYGMPISLTRSGIPRILPTYFRKEIRNGNVVIIKYILTILNLYRVLPYKGKVKLSTITDPFKGSIPVSLIKFIPLFLKELRLKPFQWEWKPFVLSSAGPIKLSVLGTYREKDPKTGEIKTLFLSKGNSTAAFLPSLVSLYSSPLWSNILWFFHNCPSSSSYNDVFEELTNLARGLLLTQWGKSVKDSSLGSLAFKDEPGKVRVFAMVDCITQWVLNPLHKFLFDALSKIEKEWGTDATFDQNAGVKRLQQLMKDNVGTYSFDLTAATDRLPIQLQRDLLNNIVPKLGDHWSSLLVGRSYSPPSGEALSYNCGQPMGALSSWAMLAITHHLLVQYSYYLVVSKNLSLYGSKYTWFKNYLVLGDDLVICDSRVAKQYLHLMKTIDVGINMSKSLVSPSRKVAEFAKRFITPDFDLSPWSLKEYTSFYTGWASIISNMKSRNINFIPFLRLIGVGSKAAGHSYDIKWGSKLSIKNIYLLLFRFSKFEVKDLFRGFRQYVTMVCWKTVHDKLTFLSGIKTVLRRTIIEPSIQLVSMVNLKVLSSHELIQLRRLSHYMLDWMVMFSNKPPVVDGSFFNYGDPRRGDLVDPSVYVPVIEQLELSLYRIFSFSPLWKDLCYGSKETVSSIEKKMAFTPHATITNVDDYLKFVLDSPKLWFENPNLTEALRPKTINHIFKASPSEDPKLAFVKSASDLSKYLGIWESTYEWKIPLYNQSLLSISPPPKKRALPLWMRAGR